MPGIYRQLRRVFILLIVAGLACSQSFAQIHNATSIAIGTGGNIEFGDTTTTTVETIRLAQASASPGWSGDIDIDPPVIDHEALDSGRAGEPQEFVAGVVDDRGLQHVMLFYRARSGAQYQSADMQKVAGTDDFTVTVETLLGQDRIEYYIEALDVGGNRVLKGFPFFPLVRDLAQPTARVTGAEESEASGNRALYVLLGIAAAGLVVALVAGSGGDGGGSGETDPMPGTVPLTIEVTPP